MTSVFAKYEAQAFPYRFTASLHVSCIAGGTPTDDKVAEAWLKTKLTGNRDELIREAVATTMVERGITDVDEATKLVDSLKHLNGFKRDSERGLYIEGRQAKAMLKEAVNVAANAGKITAKGWGNPDDKNYKKGIKNWFPEHVFIMEDHIYLGVTEPSGIMQRFVHTHRGTGIQYEEYIEDAKVTLTVATDHKFTDEQWAMIWLTAEQQGIGASRSQGFGRFEVTFWEALSPEEQPAPAT
jgi:hypothetical protein